MSAQFSNKAIRDPLSCYLDTTGADEGNPLDSEGDEQYKTEWKEEQQPQFPDFSSSNDDSDEENEGPDDIEKNSEHIDRLAESLKMILELSKNDKFQKKALDLMGAADAKEFEEKVGSKFMMFVSSATKKEEKKEPLANLKNKGVKSKRKGAVKTIGKLKNRHHRAVHIKSSQLSPLSQLLRERLEDSTGDELAATFESLLDCSMDLVVTKEKQEEDEAKEDHLFFTTQDSDSMDEVIDSSCKFTNLSAVLLSQPIAQMRDSDDSEDHYEDLFNSSQGDL